MRPLSSRGFTLVELIVAVALTSVVLGSVYQSIVRTQWATRSQTQRMYVQQQIRLSALYLTRALPELDAAEGDITVADTTTLELRAMRWSGVLCTPPVGVAGGVGFLLRTQMQSGLRAPDVDLDSILLFRDRDPESRADDQWLVGGLVAQAAGVCPDGADGTGLVVNISAASGGNDSALVGVTIGSPIRGFQMEELSLYQDGSGDYWLGRRNADRDGIWTTTQPISGPLTPNGLAFTYLDSAEAPPATRADIAIVGLVIRGRSPEPARLSIGGMDYIRDSVITRVALRNNPGF